MINQILYYESKYNMQECIVQINKGAHQFMCERGTLLRYSSAKISDSQMLITFTGGQFRKIVRTEYLMEFLQKDDHTLIILRFQKEFLGLPPMTPLSDVDLFMAQKANAIRIKRQF